MEEKKVSCLKCSFMIKDMNGNEHIYKCKVHALKNVKIDTEIFCMRYQKRGKRIKDKRNYDFENYFDTEPLKNLVLEHQKK